MFELPASLLGWFYSLVHNYAIAIAMITFVVMAIITPLTLKSTKGMLEMQRLQPEMKRLQQQHRGDRQKLNEEMMKLYQEHKVNPLASCLPLLAQMPVFFIMFHVIRGLTTKASVAKAAELGIDPGSFAPQYVSKGSEIYESLLGKTEMRSFWLDLSKTPAEVMSDSFGRGLIYAGIVVLLAGLYFFQQRQIASRTVNPSMSAGQQKLMQYLPVVFAVFQLFFPTGLVVYYITQTLLRIGQNQYITKRFYGHDESLGRQAQRAGVEARELAKNDKAGSSKLGTKPAPRTSAKPPTPKATPSKQISGRTTAPKAKPTPGKAPQRPRPASSSPGSRHPKPKKK
ncbi:MAG: membrane protein insertase YidC [Acidimicrobiia bacterium]